MTHFHLKISWLCFMFLVLISCGESKQKTENIEKRKVLEARKKLTQINKSFQYTVNKISALQNIEKDTVLIFYKEYLQYFKKVEFSKNNNIINVAWEAEFEIEINEEVNKYDFVLLLVKKYHLHEKTIYKMMNILDKEEQLHKLYQEIDELIWYNEELESEIDELEGYQYE